MADAKTAIIGIDNFPPRKRKEKVTDAMKAQSEAEGSSDVKLVSPKAGEVTEGKGEMEAGGDEGELVDDLEGEDDEGTAGPSLPAEVAERLKTLEAGKDEVRSFIESGGTLIVPYLRTEDYAGWLPLKVGLADREIWKGRADTIAELTGLASSDFYFREVVEMPVISSLPEGSALQQCGLVGIAHHGNGKVVFCQLYPDYFQDTWQRTKVLRVWSALLTNLGARSVAVAPLGEGSKLSSLFYSASALDFNPDKHRSW